MKLYIGADHRGFSLKEDLKQWLGSEGHEIEDVGAHVLQPGDDYTDYAKEVGEKVVNIPESRGIVLCGSGVGVDVVANKIDGVRCGLISTPEQAQSARKDDDINVLALAADFLTLEKAKQLITVFLQTQFAHEKRYERRLEKIEMVEEQN